MNIKEEIPKRPTPPTTADIMMMVEMDGSRQEKLSSETTFPFPQAAH
jgi:hypothetical protein